MGFANDVKNEFKEEFKEELKDELKHEAANGVKAGAQRFATGVRDTVRDTFRGTFGGSGHAGESGEDGAPRPAVPAWKIAAGVAAAVALVGVAVLVSRRRARASTLLERGMREGARYAVLVTPALRKTRESAEELAHEALDRWDKRPRLKVHFK